MTAYEDIKAINWSTLKHMATSPLMYKWRLEHPEPRKDVFVFGGAVHTLILEPEKFDARYAVFDGRRDPRTKAWQEWQAQHPGVEALKPDELERVKRVAEAVRKHRVAGPLVRGGRREEVVTWTDEVTGLKCKGRLDYIRPDCFLDVKSAYDVTPLRFERAAVDLGYPGQIGFYNDGTIAARLLDGRKRPFIIAPQTDEPFDVVAFQMKPEFLELGRAHYRSLLHRLIECTEADYWPGVAPELVQLGVPPWAETKLFGTHAEEDF